MDKKRLTIPIILALALTACVTGSDPSSSSWLSSGKCPTGIILKVDGKAIPVTAPNPFYDVKNPGMEFFEGNFSLGLMTNEAGMFELQDLKIAQLKTGTFTGNKFNFTLLNSPYAKNGACSHARYKQNSKLIIEEYNADTGQLNGCFSAKLDCDGKQVEINAAVSGIVP